MCVCLTYCIIQCTGVHCAATHTHTHTHKNTYLNTSTHTCIGMLRHIHTHTHTEVKFSTEYISLTFSLSILFALTPLGRDFGHTYTNLKLNQLGGRRVCFVFARHPRKHAKRARSTLHSTRNRERGVVTNLALAHDTPWCRELHQFDGLKGIERGSHGRRWSLFS